MLVAIALIIALSELVAILGIIMSVDVARISAGVIIGSVASVVVASGDVAISVVVADPGKIGQFTIVTG